MRKIVKVNLLFTVWRWLEVEVGEEGISYADNVEKIQVEVRASELGFKVCYHRNRCIALVSTCNHLRGTKYHKI